MNHQVFISYSSANREVADQICRVLEAEALNCWIAHRDVMPGMAYGESIIDAINSSQIFILILSNQANRSEQVIREVERAVSKGLPILPLRIEDIRLSKNMEYFISSQHWMDAFPPPLDHHVEKLLRATMTLLGKQLPPQQSPMPVRRPTPARRSSWRTWLAGACLVMCLSILASVVIRDGDGAGAAQFVATTLPSTAPATETPISKKPAESAASANEDRPGSRSVSDGRAPVPAVAKKLGERSESCAEDTSPVPAGGALVVVIEQTNPMRPERQRQFLRASEAAGARIDFSRDDAVTAEGERTKQYPHFESEWGLGVFQQRVTQALRESGVIVRAAAESSFSEGELAEVVERDRSALLVDAARQVHARVVVYGVAKPRFLGTRTFNGLERHSWTAEVRFGVLLVGAHGVEQLQGQSFRLPRPKNLSGEDVGREALYDLAEYACPRFVEALLDWHSEELRHEAAAEKTP